MVRVKKMNESYFAKLLKEFNVAGELIRERQEEKQGLLDDFDRISKRFFFGKISARVLSSSVRKVNKELSRLNGEIRANMAKARNAGNKSMVLTSAQTPIAYRATLSGIAGGEKKKVKKARRPVRKKVKKARRPARKPAKRKVEKARRPVRRKVRKSRKKTSKKK